MNLVSLKCKAGFFSDFNQSKPSKFFASVAFNLLQM